MSKETKIAKKEQKAAKKAAKLEKKQTKDYAKLVASINKKNAKAEAFRTGTDSYPRGSICCRRTE